MNTSTLDRQELTNAIKGKTLWLTRPLFQTETLSEQLQSAGADVVLLPMIDIKPLEYDQEIKDRVLNLDQIDLIFFISTNAAKLGLRCFDHFWPQLPAHLEYFAVGPSTATLVEQDGLRVHFPQTGMSSEALLALPELQDIAGKKALICRGVGGREILAQGLSERQAEVNYLELYHRELPHYSDQFITDLVQDKAPNAIVLTSSEALSNFIALFQIIWPTLFSAQVLVSSQRIADEAYEAGFKRVNLMTGANDEGIIDGLKAVFAR